MKLNTNIAQKAWGLSPVSKSELSECMLNELIDSYLARHKNVNIKEIRNLEGINTWGVVAEVDKELISLYDDWNSNFERHGYEPPFILFHEVC